MKVAIAKYHARMLRVLDHIDQHIDAELDLDRLSNVAAFSKYHFHRQFAAVCGLSVHRYVQLIRMKRASYQLAYRDEQSVTAIAMDAGYDAPDAFARAFRARIGQSPSAFRKHPDWETWLAAFGPFHQARSKLMQPEFTLDDVTIREVSPIPVLFMQHRGDPAAIGTTIQQFIAWRKARDLRPSNSNTFNIFHTDPHSAPVAEYRLDLCVETDRKPEADDDHIESGLIPGGRCAVMRLVGNSDDLGTAALFLYRDWLPASGEEAGDFPLYCQRISFYPDVPAHQAVTELFLPLA